MLSTNTIEAFGQVRLQLNGHLFVLLENWRRSQPKIPSRAEAIRKLIEQALTEQDGRRTEAAA